MTVLLVALGAGLGAPLRFMTAARYDAVGAPRGTLAVNLVGAFLLGLFSAAALGGQALALLGTGFCGGLTTYSSFALQSVRLPRPRAAAYVALTVGGSLAACAAGWVVGQA